MTNPYPGDSRWPTNANGCTVTGSFVGFDGVAVTGTVSFTASPTAVLDIISSPKKIIVPKTLTATLDSTGSFSIILPATDDTDLNPNGWSYSVSENFVGGRKYNIYAPQNSTVDLADISPVPNSQGAPIYRGPKGEAGGVQMVNGHTGDIITLSYTDVGADEVGAASAAQLASLQKSANLSDLVSAPTARTNLGLGNIATHPTTDFDLAGTAQTYGDSVAPVGVMQVWPGVTPPSNKWQLCQGQAVSRTGFAALYGVLGTVYGAGDGNTTFNLPDLRGKVVVQQDIGQAEFQAMAQVGGEKFHTLDTTEMPSHGHDVIANGYDYVNGQWDSVGDGHGEYQRFHLAFGRTATKLFGESVGGGGAHNNLQPYLIMNYIIRVQ